MRPAKSCPHGQLRPLTRSPCPRVLLSRRIRSTTASHGRTSPWFACGTTTQITILGYHRSHRGPTQAAQGFGNQIFYCPIESLFPLPMHDALYCPWSLVRCFGICRWLVSVCLTFQPIFVVVPAMPLNESRMLSWSPGQGYKFFNESSLGMYPVCVPCAVA